MKYAFRLRQIGLHSIAHNTHVALGSRYLSDTCISYSSGAPNLFPARGAAYVSVTGFTSRSDELIGVEPLRFHYVVSRVDGSGITRG
ncbi:hypothetical protein BgiBS90_030012 [Biomphalaria glabrata]|nr:hypothetical protein BgiBS90_030012 [Biomphalaria glabrata]